MILCVIAGGNSIQRTGSGMLLEQKFEDVWLSDRENAVRVTGDAIWLSASVNWPLMAVTLSGREDIR